MSAEVFYLSCFGTGLVLSLLAFAGGFGHLHLGHLHFHAGHPHTSTGYSPVNGFTVMAFVCWFGGSGYLLTHYHLFLVPIVFALAVLTGLAGAAIIFLFLIRVLLPHERTLLPEHTEMRGVLARVSSSVRPHGTGEILFSLDGTRRVAAARTESGEPLPRDTQVLVLRYERGIAWVRPFTDLD